MFFLFLIGIYLIISSDTFAQDLSMHKWEKRLIVIYAHDQNNSTYLEQLEELIENEEGLLERKILVYRILPEVHIIGLQCDNGWKKNTHDAIKNIPFQIELIGLDGGIKLSQNKLLTSEKLFAEIDKMPMRRIELQDKK